MEINLAKFWTALNRRKNYYKHHIIVHSKQIWRTVSKIYPKLVWLKVFYDRVFLKRTVMIRLL
jgi:hypothetical protein